MRTLARQLGLLLALGAAAAAAVTDAEPDYWLYSLAEPGSGGDLGLVPDALAVSSDTAAFLVSPDSPLSDPGGLDDTPAVRSAGDLLLLGYDDEVQLVSGSGALQAAWLAEDTGLEAFDAFAVSAAAAAASGPSSNDSAVRVVVLWALDAAEGSWTEWSWALDEPVAEVLLAVGGADPVTLAVAAPQEEWLLGFRESELGAVFDVSVREVGGVQALAMAAGQDALYVAGSNATVLVYSGLPDPAVECGLPLSVGDVAALDVDELSAGVARVAAAAGDGVYVFDYTLGGGGACPDAAAARLPADGVSTVAVSGERVAFGAPGAGNADADLDGQDGRAYVVAFCGADRYREADAGAWYVKACADCAPHTYSAGGTADACEACYLPAGGNWTSADGCDYACFDGLFTDECISCDEAMADEPLMDHASWVLDAHGEACFAECDEYYTMDANGSYCEPPAPPAAVDGAACLNVTAGAVLLSWAAPAAADNESAPIDFFVVDWGAASALVGADAVQLDISGLSADTSYNVTVTPHNLGGYGPAAAADGCTTLPPEPPAAPAALSAVAANWSALVVSVEAPADTGGAPLTTFEACTDDNNHCAAGADADYLVLTQLQANTTYSVTARAANYIGFGDASEPIRAKTGLATEPSAPRALSGSADCCSVALEWLPPGDSGGAEVTRYTVTLVRDSTGTTTAQTTTDTSLAVTGLVAAHDYSVSVYATNAVGPSDESSTLALTTFAAEPASAPSLLAVSNVSATSFIAHWAAPSDLGGAEAVDSYALSVGNATVVTADGDADSVHVYGLDADTTYELVLTAQTVAGDSNASAPLSVTTGPPSAPAAPDAVWQTGASFDRVSVAWTASAETGGSPLLGFSLCAGNGSLAEAVALGADECLAAADAGAADAAADLVDLAAQQSYWVWVAAANEVGLGPWSAGARAQTDPPEEPGAVQNLAVVNGSETCCEFQLAWDAPASDGGAAVTAYAVLVLGSDGNSDSFYFDPDEDQGPYTVDQRLALEEYTAYVLALNAVGYGPSALVEAATTAPDVPAAPNYIAAKDVTSTTARIEWNSPYVTGGDPVSGFRVWVDGAVAADFVDNADARELELSALAPLSRHNASVSARNSAGLSPRSDVVEFVMDAPAAPDAPADFAVAARASWHTVAFNWTEPLNDGGEAVTQYVLAVGDATATVAAPASAGAIDGLEAGTAYNASVRAENSIGVGAAAELLVTTGAPTAPSAVRSLAVVGGVGGCCGADLAWLPPLDSGGSDVSLYAVLVDGEPVSVRTVTNATLSGLQARANYTVSVLPLNAVGYGEQADVVVATGEPERPDPPTAVTVVGTTATTVAVEWAAPAWTGGQDVASYEVWVSSQEDGGGNYTLAGSTDGPETAYEALHLVPWTAYDVAVAAVQDAGASELSEPANATTGPPSPPDAPDDVWAFNVTHDSLGVAWSEPRNDGGADISACELCSNDTSPALCVTTDAYAHTVDGLLAQTEYSFAVRCENSRGFGAWTPAQPFSTGDFVPASAPQALALVNATCCALTVTWAAPADLGGSAAVAGYVVEVAETGDVFDVAAPPARLASDALLADSTYTVAVSAVTEAGAGAAAEAQLQTGAAELPSAPSALAVGDVGVTAVALSWAAPESLGGAAVAYEVVSGADASWSSVGSNTSATATGLVRATAYSFAVRAVNAAGAGPLSSAVNATTLSTVPAAVDDIEATLVDAATFAAAWGVPADDGGAALTGFELAVGDELWWRPVGARNLTVDGQEPSSNVTLLVRALNANGEGAWGSLALQMPDPLPCPADCSGHGTCHAYLGTCACDEEPLPYRGANCSRLDGETVELTIAGDVETFDADALLAELAAILGVDAGRLYVARVEAGSVVLEVLVRSDYSDGSGSGSSDNSTDVVAADDVIAELVELAEAGDGALAELGVEEVSDPVDGGAIEIPLPACEAEASCGACGAVDGCVWCPASHSCMLGSAAEGPSPGYECALWLAVADDCPDCAALTSCDDCLAQLELGCDAFCADTQSCAEAPLATGECGSGGWEALSEATECPVPCDELGDDCEACMGSAGCGFCASPYEPGACASVAELAACDGADEWLVESADECVDYVAPAARCPAYASCGDCVADPDCGYCSLLGQCKTATYTSCPEGWGEEQCVDFCDDGELNDQDGSFGIGNDEDPMVYEADAACAWTLLPQKSTVSTSEAADVWEMIYLTISRLELGEDAVIKVYSDDSPSASPMKTITGNRGATSISVEVDTGYMRVTFASSGPDVGYGFDARYTSGPPSLFDVYFIAAVVVSLVLLCLLFVCCCSKCCSCFRGRGREGPGGAGGGPGYRFDGPGMPPELIMQLPSHFHKPVEEVGGEEVDPCSICLGEFEVNEQVRRLHCNHLFHQSCIDTWLSLNRVCPLCKRDVVQMLQGLCGADDAAAGGGGHDLPGVEMVEMGHMGFGGGGGGGEDVPPEVLAAIAAMEAAEAAARGPYDEDEDGEYHDAEYDDDDDAPPAAVPPPPPGPPPPRSHVAPAAGASYNSDSSDGEMYDCENSEEDE